MLSLGPARRKSKKKINPKRIQHNQKRDIFVLSMLLEIAGNMIFRGFLKAFPSVMLANNHEKTQITQLTQKIKLSMPSVLVASAPEHDFKRHY